LEDCSGKSCPPLRVQVDGKAIHAVKVAPSINNTNVLTFFFPDDSSLLREMKAGRSMTVTFQDGASTKPWVEKFSLMGLTAALAQFEKTQAGS
jgi:invasion protein IalB